MRKRASFEGANETQPATATQDALQKFKEKVQVLQFAVIDEVNEKLSSTFEDFMREIENIRLFNNYCNSNELLYDRTKYSNRKKANKDGQLPDKQFIARESILTDLFRVKHIHAIYNIFIAFLIILFLNTAVYDLIVDGELKLGLSLIQWNFGGFTKVLMYWVIMMCGTLIIYISFCVWTDYRTNFLHNLMLLTLWDYGWLIGFIIYQTMFAVSPAMYLLNYKLPPASSIALLMEQVRIMMKVHAFIRTCTPLAMKYNSTSVMSPYPQFGHFIYFLFVPTLVYRSTYPRTNKICWREVSRNFLEVIGVIFYVSFLFERFLLPGFRNFGKNPISPETLVVTIFGAIMPATLVFLCAFYLLLHAWQNAFAEITQFADRMFYKDWWNANSYVQWFRMWNVVVHDWLYSYIYKDLCEHFKTKSRFLPTVIVFFVSAFVHEYILMFTFGFCYPMLFIAFGIFSAILVLITKDPTQGSNILMWLSLCSGVGLLFSLYLIEWYARANCPSKILQWDFFLPRTWSCDTLSLAS